jgi:hypothetical protein
MTLDQVAAVLRRHPELVRRWLVEGRLRGKKLAGRWFVTRADLARFRRDQPERRER